MAAKAIEQIAREFRCLTSSPEKITMIVLLLHDVTGIKKKVIREVLEYGPQLDKIYKKDQDFSVNKKPKAKIGKKTKPKKKKA